MNTQEIKTPLGFIRGRDAIILKNIKTEIYPNKLGCFLEIDSRRCSHPLSAEDTITCNITFEKVLFYSLYSLDYCPIEKYIKSGFDEITDSEFLQKYNLGNNFIHLVLSCYDHIIEVVCENYVFERYEKNNSD